MNILIEILETSRYKSDIMLKLSVIALVLISCAASASHLSERPDYASRRQPMVAIYCDSTFDQEDSKTIALFHNQFYNMESHRWQTDHSPSAYCTRDKREILNYCRKVYPSHDIQNIVEHSKHYKLDNWCKLGSKRRCRTKLSIKPYRCLEGSFQSDALLVPEKCAFDHLHNKTVCDSSNHWNKTATQSCASKNMNLQSFAMLQPCGLGVFSGVEFVCCPHASQKKADAVKYKKHHVKAAEDAAQAINHNSSDDDEKSNEIKTDDSSVKSDEVSHEPEMTVSSHHKSDDDSSSGDDDEDEADEEYEEETDEYDDDSSSWGENELQSSTTITTTTTTTPRPIDFYLSHFDLAHEHDDFRKAELAVENNYKEKITHVMKEWGDLDGRYQEMLQKDPAGAEEFKKRMSQRFEKTVEALEEEGAAERHQLISMHTERAMTIINRRKKVSMDCLTQALDRKTIKTKQVEKCLTHLLQALEKDRSHTLRQYKTLLNLNTREALREKNTIFEHLVTLNRAANQSIAMLDRSPALANRLKTKVTNFWHNLRNIPIDEQITKESELKVMEQFEEEVAQRKIKKERQRLLDDDSPHEPVDIIKQADNISANTNIPEYPKISTETTPKPTVATTEFQTTESSKAIEESKQKDVTTQKTTSNEDIENGIHVQFNSPKYSHMKADATHHKLYYTTQSESIQNQLNLGSPTFLVGTCAVVVIAIALMGVRFISNSSSKFQKRRGFVEVGLNDPEEKSVTNMQVNGYENPAYKFFEAEA